MRKMHERPAACGRSSHPILAVRSPGPGGAATNTDAGFRWFLCRRGRSILTFRRCFATDRRGAFLNAPTPGVEFDMAMKEGLDLQRIGTQVWRLLRASQCSALGTHSRDQALPESHCAHSCVKGG